MWLNLAAILHRYVRGAMPFHVGGRFVSQACGLVPQIRISVHTEEYLEAVVDIGGLGKKYGSDYQGQ